MAEEKEEPASASVRDFLKTNQDDYGLTTAEMEAARGKYGFNEVVVEEQPLVLQILSRYLGIVPLFMTTTAVLSAAIFSDCTVDLE